jgi:predicted nucleic acid-binding protein
VLLLVAKILHYPLSIDHALIAAKLFASNLKILYPDPLSSNFLFSLLAEYQVVGLTVHDFEIAAIAISNDVKRIATVNKSDFERIKEVNLICPD